MSERDDTETGSRRVERGEPELPDARSRMADVPLAPHSAGVVGPGPGSGGESSSASADQAAAEERERERRDE